MCLFLKVFSQQKGGLFYFVITIFFSPVAINLTDLCPFALHVDEPLQTPGDKPGALPCGAF